MSKAYRYIVKWKTPHGQQYGIHYKDSSPKPKKGCVLVELPIRGELLNIPEADVEDVEGEELCAYYDKMDKILERAVQDSEALPPGLVRGKLFYVGVADGRAWYEVIKVGKKNVEIAWVGYDPDRYFDQVLGGGGSFPRHCIEHLVK